MWEPFYSDPNIKVLWHATAKKCVISWHMSLFRSIIRTKCDLVTGLSYLIKLRPDSHV